MLHCSSNAAAMHYAGIHCVQPVRVSQGYYWPALGSVGYGVMQGWDQVGMGSCRVGVRQGLCLAWTCKHADGCYCKLLLVLINSFHVSLSCCDVDMCYLTGL